MEPQFGRLTPINKLTGGHNSLWLFYCECGNFTKALRNNVVRGLTRSCGCLRREEVYDNSPTLSHGFIQKYKSDGKNPRFYAIWSGMKTRCLNANSASYPNYGARGVTIDRPWLKFSNFLADMYTSYLEHCTAHGERDTTLDRIDNKKGYSKDNCRWATRLQQARNKRPKISPALSTGVDK